MLQFPKPTKTKRWNTKRNITKEVKEYIIERDRVCIICEHEYIQTCHHAMYGLEQDLWTGRNNPEYLVWLCDKCHYTLHFQWDNDYRERAIEYLNNYYAKPNI